MAVNAPLYLGIDLGGTKILALVGTDHGNTLGESLTSTPTSAGPEAVAEAMASAAKDAVQQAGVDLTSIVGVGVAAAGGIQPSTGVVVESPNVRSLTGHSLMDLLRKHFSPPIVVVNDANAAALAEHRFGAGQGVANLLYMTVSTGIGGGIIINGELYQGTHGFAAEVGHITVAANGPVCQCGRHGCLETMASGTALAREAKARLAAGESSVLQALVKQGGPDSITAERVFEALAQNDSLARAVVEQGSFYLGIGLKSLVNVLDPDRIVIGGGLSNQWESYIAPAVEIMREQAFANMGKDLPVVPPALGVQTGALGAIAVAASAG
jgi:glucokinase